MTMFADGGAQGSPPATDLDLRLDCTPNPCDANDPTIPNSDSVPLENGPQAPGNDITILNNDTTNDSCDIDDDNDGILDAYEGDIPSHRLSVRDGAYRSAADRHGRRPSHRRVGVRNGFDSGESCVEEHRLWCGRC